MSNSAHAGVRSRLVTRPAMLDAFQVLKGEGTPLNLEVREYLLQYAGFEAGPSEVARLIMRSLELTFPADFPVMRTVELLFGEEGREAASETKKLLISIAMAL